MRANEGQVWIETRMKEKGWIQNSFQCSPQNTSTKHLFWELWLQRHTGAPLSKSTQFYYTLRTPPTWHLLVSECLFSFKVHQLRQAPGTVVEPFLSMPTCYLRIWIQILLCSNSSFLPVRILEGSSNGPTACILVTHMRALSLGSRLLASGHFKHLESKVADRII